VDEIADGLDVKSVVQVGNVSMPGVITDDSETLWITWILK